MSLDNVESALKQAAIAALGVIPTAWENNEFTRPESGKWAEVFFVPNTPDVNTLGADGQDQVTGFMQFTLHYSRGTGTAEARADFEAIRDVFPAGASFTHSGTTARIKSCGRSQGRNDKAGYTVYITINFYAHIAR